jgi:hypothetical protein
MGRSEGGDRCQEFAAVEERDRGRQGEEVDEERHGNRKEREYVDLSKKVVTPHRQTLQSSPSELLSSILYPRS